jgi:hypothetical protein
MFPCKQLLEFDLEMVSNFSENADILEYEIKFEKNLKACDWPVCDSLDRLSRYHLLWRQPASAGGVPPPRPRRGAGGRQ